MTVDGVISVGEWYVAGGEHDRAAREQFEQAAAMLLGRKTYEGLAAFWSAQTGEWADLLNPMPKFVASRTLQGRWTGTPSHRGRPRGGRVEAEGGARRRSDADRLGELARWAYLRASTRACPRAAPTRPRSRRSA